MPRSQSRAAVQTITSYRRWSTRSPDCVRVSARWSSLREPDRLGDVLAFPLLRLDASYCGLVFGGGPFPSGRSEQSMRTNLSQELREAGWLALLALALSTVLVGLAVALASYIT